MTEYEFRLVTQVTRGEEGSGFMGNYVLEYVVLGTWTDADTDTSDIAGESNLEVMNADLAREAMKKVQSRHVIVDIPEVFVQHDYINLRSSRNEETADNIIGQIPNQTELDVTLLNDSEVWVQTTYDGKTGYILIRVSGTPVVREIEKTKQISYYELLMAEPSDWSTNYASYFTRNANGTYSPVEGIDVTPEPAEGEEPPETQTVAPTWQRNKYYRYVENQQTDGNITTGALVRVKASAEFYYNLNVAIPAWVKEHKWYVLCVTNSERVVIDASEDGKYHIMSPVHIKDLEFVSGEPESEPETENEGG